MENFNKLNLKDGDIITEDKLAIIDSNTDKYNANKTEILNTIGTEEMGTTATTIKGAIAEHTLHLNDIAINVKQFGAVGDGVTDDTLAIQTAINSILNGTLIFESGATYKITSPITKTTGDITVEGNNATLLWYGTVDLGNNNKTNFDRGCIEFIGEEENNAVNIISITKDDSGIIEKVKYTTKLTVEDSSSFTVGDYVFINCTEYSKWLDWDTSYNDYKPVTNVLSEILHINGNDIFVNYVVPFTYSNPVVQGTIKKINPIKNLKISNLKFIDMAETTGETLEDEKNKWVNGISIKYGVDVKINNYSSKYHRFKALKLVSCLNVNILEVKAKSAKNLSAGCGYGVQVAASTNVNLEKIIGYGNRHLIDFSSSTYCSVTDSKENSTATFCCHGIGEYDIKFTRCNGDIQLGNGISQFPIVIEKVTIDNCEIGYLYYEFVHNINIINSTIDNFFKRDTQRVNNLNIDNCRLSGNVDIRSLVADTRGGYYDDNIFAIIMDSTFKYGETVNNYPLKFIEYNSVSVSNCIIHSNGMFNGMWFNRCESINIDNNTLTNFGFRIDETTKYKRNLIPKIIKVKNNMFKSNSNNTLDAFLNFDGSLSSSTLNLILDKNIFNSEAFSKRWIRFNGIIGGANSYALITNNILLGILTEIVDVPNIVNLNIFDLNNINNATFPSPSKLIKTRKITFLDSIPTSGTWNRGDYVINNMPAVGSPKGWICTASGVSGEWVSVGNL